MKPFFLDGTEYIHAFCLSGRNQLKLWPVFNETEERHHDGDDTSLRSENNPGRNGEEERNGKSTHREVLRCEGDTHACKHGDDSPEGVHKSDACTSGGNSLTAVESLPEGVVMTKRCAERCVVGCDDTKAGSGDC